MVAFRGYSNYGSNTYYVDPASGGVGVSFNYVAKYGTYSSNSMMVVMGARGYVW